MTFIKIIILFGFIFIGTTFNASAEIYRSVDASGVVTFSDQPNATAKPVTLPAANIAKQPPQPIEKEKKGTDADTTTITAASTKHVDYTTFVINSPKNQDTLQNVTEITVSVDIEPALQEGDKIQFLLDDSPILSPTTDTSITIPSVQNGKELIVRGSHTLSATVSNSAGDVLNTTPPITIFAHYTTLKEMQMIQQRKTGT